MKDGEGKVQLWWMYSNGMVAWPVMFHIGSLNEFMIWFMSWCNFWMIYYIIMLMLVDSFNCHHWYLMCCTVLLWCGGFPTWPTRPGWNIWACFTQHCTPCEGTHWFGCLQWKVPLPCSGAYKILQAPVSTQGEKKTTYHLVSKLSFVSHTGSWYMCTCSHVPL